MTISGIFDFNMESLKWTSFNKPTIIELATSARAAGIDITFTEAMSKSELVGLLEFAEVTPAAAMGLKYSPAASTTIGKQEQPKAKLQPQGKDEEIGDFFTRFKAWIETRGFPKELWVGLLWENISPEVGKILASFEGQKNSFEEIQLFLLRQYKITPEAQLKRFRTEKKKKDESFLQFGYRLKRFLTEYLSLDNEKFDSMKEGLVPMLLEQLLSGVTLEFGNQVRRRLDGKWTDLDKILQIFDQELEFLAGKEESNSQMKKEKPERKDKICSECGKSGHWSKNCWTVKGNGKERQF